MAFKMSRSPLLKDVKMYDGNGDQITVDDSTLGKVYRDDNGNEARDYNYTTKDGEKGVDILYITKPRGESEIEEGEGPKTPSDRPIEGERFFT